VTKQPLVLSARLSGRKVLVLNWRDVRHPQAGGAEQYMYQISRRWVEAGVNVTWLTARAPGQARRDSIEGIPVTRLGGPLSVYPMVALQLLATRGKFDAVIDCQNGIPFFSPLFAGHDVPIVQVIHHVHQDQFSTRFSRPLAAVGRALEGRMSNYVYHACAIATVSPSTRLEIRRQLKFQGPVFIIPNGTIDVPTLSGPRDPDPTITVVSRLVPHKRIEFLLGQIASVAPQIPRLRVNIVGDGPERARLRGLTLDLGLQRTVTLHGYQTNSARDALLSRAWLTTSTSIAEGWGCSVIEAAAWGVPCVALNVPGIRDSVIANRTGWLVNPQDFSTSIVRALNALADENHARQIAATCQNWARCFSWDRSAELLAGVLLERIGTIDCLGRHATSQRLAHSDIGTFARFSPPHGLNLRSVLRSTDEIAHIGGEVSVLFAGCDEFDAAAVLQRLGVFDASLRLAVRHDLLVGPGALDIIDDFAVVPRATDAS
jgi:glycosyltransferase involved in cell wall biosynthesis